SHAKAMADKIAAAEKAMQEAKSALVKNAPNKATPSQETAAKQLKETREELDKLLASAEKQGQDPLAALKKAMDNIDSLLKDQTDTRAQTQAAAKDTQNLKVPALAGKQKELAQRTGAVKNQPATQKSAPALDKAAQAMKDAAGSLQQKKAPDAIGKQDEAIKALEQARKELGEQVAEMQKRRDDIAKLEDAAQKLDELAKQEGKIADQAKELTKQSPAQTAKELGQKQDTLVPPTKDIGKDLQKSAPEAAQKVSEASKQ